MKQLCNCNTVNYSETFKKLQKNEWTISGSKQMNTFMKYMRDNSEQNINVINDKAVPLKITEHYAS